MKRFSSQGIFSSLIINISSKGIARSLRLILLILISYKFGASHETDAYFVAQSITLSFLLIAESVFINSFLPVFIDYKENKDEEEAWKIANTTSTIISICFLLISLLIFIFAPQIAFIMAPGFSKDTLLLTARLIRIVSPIPFLFGLFSIPIVIFYSFKSYIVPAVTNLFYGGGGYFDIFVACK